MIDMPPDDDDEIEYCPVCGLERVWEDCWQCHGDGGEYPHDTDPIGYEPDEFIVCDICRGDGGYLVCPNAENHPRSCV